MQPDTASSFGNDAGYDAFFFDFDGVIADSLHVKTRAFEKLFEQHGPEIQAMVRDYHLQNGGMPRRDKFHYFYNRIFNRTPQEEEMERLCERFSAYVVDDVVASPEIPGASQFVEKWHQRVPCFVVSATPDEEIRNIVTQRGLAAYFREVLGSGLSKSENLRYLLETYRFQSQRCIFFGDAESDFRAAKECQVPFFGICHNHNDRLLSIDAGIRWAHDFEAIRP